MDRIIERKKNYEMHARRVVEAFESIELTMEETEKNMENWQNSQKDVHVEVPLQPNTSKGYLFLKRCFDIVASILAILLLSPVMLITAIAIKVEDPHGRVVYKAPRGGKNREPFMCLNLRWMKTIDNLHRECAVNWPVSCAAIATKRTRRGFRHQFGCFKLIAAA